MYIKLETLDLTRYDAEKHRFLKEDLENGESASRFIHQMAQRLDNSIYAGENIFQSAFVVLDREIPIGYVYISSNKNDEVFLEYSLLKSFRGMGYGKRLLNEVSNYLFENHNIRCIKGDVDPSNKNSQMMLESCGYEFAEEDYEERNFMGNMVFFKESECYVSKRKR